MNGCVEEKQAKQTRWKQGVLLWMVIIFLLGMKPIHLDEANFLMLTRGDWWAPHLIMVNWEGVTEPAFDVLSNPPGMAWLLWPVKDVSVEWMRLWVLPWSVLTLWGMSKLLNHWGINEKMVLLFAVSPFFALSHNSLMPEMPLLACTVCGWQGILHRRKMVFWSVVLGFASWFRYSGLSMIPLLFAWIIYHRPHRGWLLAIGCMTPTLLLIMHDLQAYGEWHFWHMVSFQQEQQSWQSLVHKEVAFLAMLGGGFALPIFPRDDTRILLLSGLVMTLLMKVLSTIQPDIEYDLWALWWGGIGVTILFASIYQTYIQRHWWLLLWIFGGVIFLLNLRFAATRYWGPFMIPILLMTAKRMEKLSRGWMLIWAIISGHLVWDDTQLAKSQHALARKLSEKCDGDIGYFSGHWGWQYRLESRDWVGVDDDSLIPNNVCYMYTSRSWPQEVTNSCWSESISMEEKYHSYGLPLRVHTVEGKSNYHAFMISGQPPIRTLAPWGIGWDYWDKAFLRKTCRF